MRGMSGRPSVLLSIYLFFGFAVGLSACLSTGASPVVFRVLYIPIGVALSYIIFRMHSLMLQSFRPFPAAPKEQSDAANSSGGLFARLRSAALQSISFSGRLSENTSSDRFIFVAAVLGSLWLSSEIALAFGLRLASSLLGIALQISLALFFLSMGFQRMHDRHRSGWWLLVFFGPFCLTLGSMGWLMDHHASENSITLTFLLGMIASAPTFVWGMFETAWLPPKG